MRMPTSSSNSWMRQKAYSWARHGDFKNKIGPLIRPPAGDLARALATPAPGESWALEPTCVDKNARLWTPGIKYGVRPGSFMHLTELFGPVLGVMCADDLDHAISLANATGYGSPRHRDIG